MYLAKVARQDKSLPTPTVAVARMNHTTNAACEQVAASTAASYQFHLFGVTNAAVEALGSWPSAPSRGHDPGPPSSKPTRPASNQADIVETQHSNRYGVTWCRSRYLLSGVHACARDGTHLAAAEAICSVLGWIVDVYYFRHCKHTHLPLKSSFRSLTIQPQVSPT